MQRHASILGVVSRCSRTLYQLSTKQKSVIRPICVPCVGISSTTALCAVTGKMGDTQSGLSESTNPERPGKIKLSEKEWKEKLTSEEYQVTRQHGTEPAWTGNLLNNKEKGLYVCTCCGAELFSSAVKFDSGSGWPSFSDVLKDKDARDMLAVDTVRDASLGMVRTEVRCGKCDAHLGHVFNDGPTPTGQRYCINSVCLKFKPVNPDTQGSSS